MTVSFRIYCWPEDSEGNSETREVTDVSLCFRNAQEMRKFAEFALQCAEDASSDSEWSHEHFFGEEPHTQNIVIDLLRDENL